MKVLVTGGAGYLGAVLVPHFLDAGHTVTVLDTFRHGTPSLAAVCHQPRFDLVCADARDPYVVKPLAESHDAVIPLAAIVGAPACDKDQDLTIGTNVHAIQLLCSYLSPSQRVIYPNTNSGYGVGGTVECDETSPLNPISLYGRTKCQAEDRIRDRENSIVFRLATVFGASPRLRLDLLVNDFAYRAHSDRSVVLFEPHYRRNFVHIRDVARAFLHALDGFSTLRGEVFNVGDTRANMTKMQLCERIAAHVPGFNYYQGAGEDVDKRDYVVSNAKFEATGWAPAYTVDDGIMELLKLYRGLRPMRYGNV